MTLWTLIRRSLRFHARAHLGVLLGAAIGSAALIGALIVGDSVRGSLRERAVAKLGSVGHAMTPHDRRFTTQLVVEYARNADRASKLWLPPLKSVTSQGNTNSHTPVSIALSFHASAALQSAEARSGQTRLYGVDESFWHFGKRVPSMPSNSVSLNATLAQQLSAGPGDTVIFRFAKPSALSGETPIAGKDASSVALRLRVHEVLDADTMADFDLESRQHAPFNAFVNLTELQAAAGEGAIANVLLAVAVEDSGGKPVLPASRLTDRLTRYWERVAGNNHLLYRDYSNEAGGEMSAIFLKETLRYSIRLKDYELDVQSLPSAAKVELKSGRIFLDLPVAIAIERTMTEGAFQPLLTYLVNQLRHGTNAAPYSRRRARRSRRRRCGTTRSSSISGSRTICARSRGMKSR
jgi:putative ABC transport system permease protein